MKKLTLFVAVAGLVALSAFSAAERKIVITKDMVMDCSTPNYIMNAFDGIFLQDASWYDCSRYAHVDFGQPYHLTRILFTGRPDNGECSFRMHDARFVVSDDGETWTTIYTVPTDFQQLVGVTNEVPLVEADITTRYAGWEDVNIGSISEMQWMTDIREIAIEMGSFTDISETGATMNFKVFANGSFQAGAKVSVTAYKSPVDHGADLAAWTAAGDVVTQDLGEFEPEAASSAVLTGIAGADTVYVRLLMSCEDVTQFQQDPAGYCWADRLIAVNKNMVIDCASPNTVGIAFDGVLWHGSDCSSWAKVDLGAVYHLTKIRFSGRTGNICDVRMHNARFTVSDDGVTWRTVHTVPADFRQVEKEVLTTIELAERGIAVRYVGWENVDTGSICEAQWFTDTDLVLFTTPQFVDANAEGATAKFAVAKSGDYPVEAKVSLVAYKSPTDLGNDFADWAAAVAAGDAETQDLGEVDAGADLEVFIRGLSTGEDQTKLRFLATCAGITTFSSDTLTFAIDRNPLTYVEWRPIPNSVQACKDSLLHYNHGTYNKDHQYRPFDGDTSTAAMQPLSAIDYGRPVRIDRVVLMTTGAANFPLQGSNDGWNWTSFASRTQSDPMTASIVFETPQVYRYFRLYQESTASTPAISEVYLYGIENAPYVAVDNETEGDHMTAGVLLGGTVFAGGTNEIETVTLRAWIADTDYGPDEAAWTAAGVEPVVIGTFSVGETYSYRAAGATGKIQYVRIQAVTDVEGAANGFGERHVFTMANESVIQLTKADVEKLMIPWGQSSAVCGNVYGYQLFANRNVQCLGDYNPWGTSLPKRYLIHRIEWIPRYNTQCNKRCGSAKYYLSDAVEPPAKGTANWTLVGSGNTATGWCDRWNQIYVGGKKARHFMQSGDGNGNEQVRIWGEVAPGLMLLIR